MKKHSKASAAFVLAAVMMTASVVTACGSTGTKADESTDQTSQTEQTGEAVKDEQPSDTEETSAKASEESTETASDAAGDTASDASDTEDEQSTDASKDQQNAAADQEESQSDAEAVTSSEAQEQTAEPSYHIVILQTGKNASLTQAAEGFEEHFPALLAGETAACDVQLLSEIEDPDAWLSELEESGVDLIVAGGSGALEELLDIEDIPILGMAVTDYAAALGNSKITASGVTGRNVSGTSDYVASDEKAELLHTFLPDAVHVGLLYCKNDRNASAEAAEISGLLKKMGYRVREFGSADSEGLIDAAKAAVDDSDVIYIPNDNAAAEQADAIGEIAIGAGVPVITGDEGLCRTCGTVTVSADYHDLGEKTAEMAFDILKNQTDISGMKIIQTEETVRKYNERNCGILGIAVPDGFTPVDQ